MTHSIDAPRDDFMVTNDLGGEHLTIPASLKAEYEELTLKREQLRNRLEQAKVELAALKAKGKLDEESR